MSVLVRWLYMGKRCLARLVIWVECIVPIVPNFWVCMRPLVRSGRFGVEPRCSFRPQMFVPGDSGELFVPVHLRM
jgi:hypothetical protein